jgi:hypothetical protein
MATSSILEPRINARREARRFPMPSRSMRPARRPAVRTRKQLLPLGGSEYGTRATHSR